MMKRPYLYEIILWASMRYGGHLGLWQMGFCGLGLELNSNGTIEMCEGMLGNFHEEFDVRMRQSWSLGHCLFIQADVSSISILGEGEWYHVLLLIELKIGELPQGTLTFSSLILVCHVMTKVQNSLT